MAEHLVGTVRHYYGKLGVAGIELSSALKVGDTIHIQGHTSDFTQTVDSIQIEHETVESESRRSQLKRPSCIPRTNELRW